MDKGKGREAPRGAQEAPGAPGGAPPRAPARQLPSVASLGADMQSMLLSSGKGASASAPGTAAREYMGDVGSARGAHAPLPPHTRFRLAANPAGDDEFAAFAQSAPFGTDRQKFEHAWEAAAHTPVYDGLTAHDGLSAAEMSRPRHDFAADQRSFFAALAAEPEDAEPDATPLVPPHTALTTEWIPPLPDGPSTISEEQHAMHIELARRQADEANPFRAGERVLPEADDPALREGVYAPTPEAALATVWDAQGARAERVRAFRQTESEHDAQEVIARLRGWIVRDGYVTEVYGLPPTLVRMFGEAEQPRSDDPSTDERRERAIRRLEALCRHLSGPEGEASLAAGRAQGAGPADVMEDWLKTHT